MSSGDLFECSCGYNWRTRKDVGKPATCPKCKSKNIREDPALTQYKYKRKKEKEDLRTEINIIKKTFLGYLKPFRILWNKNKTLTIISSILIILLFGFWFTNLSLILKFLMIFLIFLILIGHMLKRLW